MSVPACKTCKAALVVKLNARKAPHAACPNGCKGGKPGITPAPAPKTETENPSKPTPKETPKEKPAAAKKGGFWW